MNIFHFLFPFVLPWSQTLASCHSNVKNSHFNLLYHQTPLWCAAGNGHGKVVEMLLGRGDVNPEKPNIHDRTPLLCAALNGHEGVVKMLLGRGDVNLDRSHKHGQTPLLCAAASGQEGVGKYYSGGTTLTPTN